MPRTIQTGMWRPVQWPSTALDTAPQPVKDAWDVYQAEVDATAKARRAVQQAIDAIGAVAAHDRQAARQAVEAGQPIPPSIRPEREQHRDDLIRTAGAREDLAEQAERALLATATEHRADWQAAITPQVEAAVTRAEAALASATDALTDLAALAAAYRWLDQAGLDRRPGAFQSQAVPAALAAARRAVVDLTPTAIQQAKAKREARQAAADDEASRSRHGIVVRR